MLAAEQAAWLRLAGTPGLGPGKAHRLLREFGLPSAIFDHSSAKVSSAAHRQRLARLCGPQAALALAQPPDPAVYAAWARAESWLAGAPERFLLTLADTDYPRPLLELHDAPVLLHGAGQRALLGAPGVAIVGSRQATHQGMANAAAFAAHLGRAGLCIVSGLAGGIDAAAHRGALQAGCATVAWLGTGADIVYPSANRRLAADISRNGLILTEYPLGTPPLRAHFPRRNRLIAAAVRGVLVVEAALQSGSLITARLAVEMGREVCAIPGSIHAPLARGCHRLIRDGARLAESAQDVLEELGWPQETRAAGAAAAGPPDPQRERLLALLGHDPVHIDSLTRRSGVDAGIIAARLLELELAGCVERLPGNRYQRLSAATAAGRT